MSGENPSSPPESLGETLLYTLDQLTLKIESQHQNRRLEMAKAYLESLTWGLKGLEEMGHRIGFRLLPEPAPKEYPKMLYKGTETKIAENVQQELEMALKGFWPRAAEPLQTLEPPEPRPMAPVISIRLPHAPNPTPESTDSEV
jgi:hypothetical protein